MYHFGSFDVYCPWDVMNYLLDLQSDPNVEPGIYWKNTSDNAIIRTFIDYAGIFAGAGYVTRSNREHGEGRSDVAVYDSVNSRAVIFEAKYSRRKEDMEKDCDRAVHQIAERKYAEDLEEDYDSVLCYGISFYKKRCLVREWRKSQLRM